jgi:ubiquinone/menaquinone biosynthesis C-methylase UbiE
VIRLNLGAGDDRREGFLSVDLRPEVADVVCDVRKLEHWGDGSVDEILAEDILEHFPQTETAAILVEWARVLRLGGLLTVKCPNMYQLSRAIIAYTDLGRNQVVVDLIRNVMGGHRWGPEGSWDTHHWNFTPTTLQGALEAAGFEVLSNDGALNMTTVARKR